MKRIKTLLFSLVPLIIAIAVQIVVALFLIPFPIKSEDDYMILVSILFSVSCILIFSRWYFKKYNTNSKPTLRETIRENFHPYEIMGLILLVPGSQFLSSILTAMISLVFPSWINDYVNLIENAGLSGDISLFMMIYSVLLAPVSEELIFRGVTLSAAKRAFPFWIANVIQALLFGLFHMNPLQGCYTFILGLILGYICEKGSIYHVIFFHFLFNLWGTTASKWFLVEDIFIQGLIIIFGTVLGLRGGFHFFRKGNCIKKEALGDS